MHRVYSSKAAAVQVARAIENDIAENAWAPGHFLGRRQEIAGRFQVAPATLSEAIQLLRSRGIVDAKPGPGGGIFVGAPSPFTSLSDHLLSLRESPATVSNCHRVLDALDGTVLDDAIEHATEDDLLELRILGERLKAQWGTANAGSEIWALHSRIARITPNELLRSLYLNIVDYITTRFSGADLAPESPERLQTHLDLIEAIATRDHRLAAQATERHRKESFH